MKIHLDDDNQQSSDDLGVNSGFSARRTALLLRGSFPGCSSY